MAKQKHYIVTGEYVTLLTQTSSGAALLGFLKGALVPADVSDESIEHHLRKGLIEEVEVAEEAPAYDPNDGPPARSGSKADWKAYALHKGMSESDAEAASRDKLADAFSEPAA